MRLKCGSGSGDDEADKSDSSGSPPSLAAFALMPKAPFLELPKRKTKTLQVGLRHIAEILKKKGKDRPTVSA
jgi:hypothetical protein